MTARDLKMLALYMVRPVFYKFLVNFNEQFQ